MELIRTTTPVRLTCH